jgi:hypothetical protein
LRLLNCRGTFPCRRSSFPPNPKVAPMKPLLLLAAIFIAGCTSQQRDQLTQQQKDQIISEVKTVCDTLWAKWTRLDGEATIQYFWFHAFTQMTLDGAGSTAAIKLAPARVEFYALAKDAVIYAWFGKSEFAMKSGDKITYDPYAVTFVFKKVGGQWKIICIHESATIKTQKAGKK